MITLNRKLWFALYALVWAVVAAGAAWQWPLPVFAPVALVCVSFVGFTDPRPKGE